MKDFTLMFVDDEPNILSSMQRMFRKSPYRVLMAPGGKEALKLMEQERVDILITDQRMPVMTGVELCRKVKDLYPFTIRIILSGYSDIDDLINAINQGEVYRFLNKPIDMNRLGDIVDRAIEQTQVIRSLLRMMEELNKELKKESHPYHYQIDYTSGKIKIGLGGDDSRLSGEIVSCLLKCLCKWPEVEQDLQIISTMLARQNGNLIINVEFGAGLYVAIELPIEDEARNYDQ